jgi:hypothetical protein
MLMGLCCGLSFRRDFKVQKFFLVFIVPVLIALYYYAVGLKGHYWFGVALYKYYFANIPWEIAVMSVVFFVYAGIFRVRQDRDVLAMAFLAVSLSMAYAFLLLFFKSGEVALAQGGSPFANRYLINLVPVGVIAMTMFCRALFMAITQEKIRLCFLIFLIFILVARCVYAYSYVHAWIGI